MAACMHHTLVLAGIFEAGLFGDRQGVDIGANADGTRTVAVFKRCDDAGLRQPARDLVAVLLKLPGNEIRGLEF
ncbi:hypothetical protein D3C87_2046410 [compost metagenome]